MKLRYKLVSLIFIISMSVIFLSSNAVIGADTPTYGGTLIDCSYADAVVLNPIVSSDSA
jgi:hypothetical protein